MFKVYTESSIQRFFTEIYHILRETDSNINEIWCEFSKISFFKDFRGAELNNFLEHFEFISIKKGNYISYIVIDKILFIIDCIKYLRYDIAQLSEILDYNGFEALVKEILSKNNYHTTTNFRFSESSKLKTLKSQKRYEIDVIGISSKFILIIDAKQWKRKDSYNSMSKAANLQFERIKALKRNPESFSKLITLILGDKFNAKKYLPFTLIPLMVTLEDNGIKFNENQIPLVSIYEFNAFLQEFSNNLHYFKSIQIERIVRQNKIDEFAI
ncbi:MAG: NERD domain-containing protein [Candidatus Hermodarchaeota archaeon]